MQDIFDGFFPSLLKGKFFECMPIIMIDETNQLYVPRIKQLINKHRTIAKALGRKFGMSKKQHKGNDDSSTSHV